MQTRFSYAPDTGHISEEYQQSVNAVLIECSGQPVYDSRGWLVNYVILVRDITNESFEEDKFREELRGDFLRRAKVLSHSMQAMNAYTWFFDPGRNRVIFGDGFERAGRKAGRINTLEKFADCLHPEDRPRFYDAVATLQMQDSGASTVEYRADLDGNGHYEWWMTRGTLMNSGGIVKSDKYMLGMSININSRKSIELELLKSKEELDSLIRQHATVLNNSSSGLAFITTDFVVQWENVSLSSVPLACEAYKKGEYCYKSAHNRTEPCENCVMQRAMDSGRTEQIQFSTEQGYTTEVIATPVLHDDGTIDGIVVRVNDVTERERMIAELRHAKARAEESDKLKSAFLASMSHEIRTPLNAIVGFSEMLIHSEPGPDRAEYIAIINKNNQLLLKLIGDIFDLSKIESGAAELQSMEFDLAEYFNGLAASMEQRITQPNVRLIVSNPYPSCMVKLDPNRFEQIVLNYVLNAIKYTEEGTIEMGYECLDDSVRLYVRDSGIGIPRQRLGKVFDHFEKVDEFAQGTGLGLAICKAIAEAMGGRVGCESRLGEGSLFWAELPCQVDVRVNKGLSPAESLHEAFTA